MKIFPILIFYGILYFQPSSAALECSTISYHAEVERRRGWMEIVLQQNWKTTDSENDFFDCVYMTKFSDSTEEDQ